MKRRESGVGSRESGVEDHHDFRLAKLAQAAVALSVAVGSLYAVTQVGEWAGEAVAERGRAEVPFSAIECPVPAGRSRAHFLQEVQYLGAFPDRLSVGEPELIDRLAEAFRAHPAVREVPAITVGDGLTLRISLALEPV